MLILENIIRETIFNDGPITFADFMDIALYHPYHGFYNSSDPFGVSGSFYTVPELTDSFGMCIAKIYASFIDNLGIKPNICEVGPGNGMLANSILNWLSSHKPTLYKNTKYITVEKSTTLAKKLSKLKDTHPKKVTVEPSIKQNYNGLILSNELIDAFPVHRIINIDGEIKELYVRISDGKLVFHPETITNTKILDYIQTMKIDTVPSQIIDINLNGVKYIQNVGKRLNKGVVLTIDYGFMSKELYKPHRMDGTATCYYRHMQNNDFFKRIGQQDITSFVDFSSLVLYGRLAGLRKVFLEPQLYFLLRSGISDDRQDIKQMETIGSLINPQSSFNNTFKVLMQTKGISEDLYHGYRLKSAEIIEQLIKEYAKSDEHD